MKFKYLSFIFGLISTLTAVDSIFAAQGNQNIFKPAIFDVSPITPPPTVPTQFDVTGYMQNASVDPYVCTDSGTYIDPRLWGGRVTVNGVDIIIPCNTILQMPATTLTWAELFDPLLTPVGTAPGTSGLTLDDKNMTPDSLALPAYEIHIQGNIVNDSVTGDNQHIAGLVFISQQSLNVGQGYIKSIDYTTGELCVSSGLPTNGLQGQSTANPQCLAPNARVRLNDAIGRFGLKHGGPGCFLLPDAERCDVEESHYDQRFTVDTDNPTIHAATGFPMCIPRAYPFGIGGDTDALCPQQNRPKQGKNGSKCTNLPIANGITFPAFPAQKDGYCHSFVMDALPVNPPPPPGPCGTFVDSKGGVITNPCTTRPDRQAPFEVGDYIDYSGTLLVDNYVPNQPVTSLYYISAHTINNHTGIYTYPGTKPVYVMIEGLLAGTNALPIQNIPQEVTSKIKVEGFTTDPSTLVDIFAMDVDKVSGLVTERFLSSVNPSGPPVIGRVRFVPATGAYAPPTRNMRIVSRSLCNSKSIACYIPQAYLDPKNPAGKYANGLVAGQYNAPNFEYIFPENLFLGDPVVPNNFQDLAFLACGSGLLTTPSAGSNPPIVEPLDPAPWAQPMPAPNQCAGKLANQLTVPVTQIPDRVTVLKATWDNKQNKGKLTVTATSSLPNATSNLQLYVQATSLSGLQLANDPQPMQLVSNPATVPAGGLPCPAGNNPCWVYSASGTILDPLHPRGNPALPTNIYTLPESVTVYSSRGGVGNIVPTLICGVITTSVGVVNTCQF
ncbi:hypothetical protein [Methylobacter psychrophilus]|uniref:hypothetical protein n=1 Tax=Methylobacter psychrophilus TaxID=96941 RepID=UPI0021D4F956|nr:hypothetical protein [Methylobacter psychrophilus]